MSIPPSGLRDEDGIFGDAFPEVSIEQRYASDPDISQESFTDSTDQLAPDTPPGVTHPSSRGSSSRFLTDVIVEMGLAPRERVDQAIEASRNEGTTPERVLLAGGAITADGLARALAERYGLDHLDLEVFPVDM